MATWSGIRKKLETEYLAQSLQGHIQYYATSYSRSHDHEGRAAIRYDGKEIIKGCYWNNWSKAGMFPQDEKYEKRIKVENAYMDDVAIKLGIFDQRCFYNAFAEFEAENAGFFNKDGRAEVLEYLKNSGFDGDKDEISLISKMIEKLENGAIDRYLKQSAHEKTLNSENELAKQRLRANAQNSNFDDVKTRALTREQIGKMSGAEFAKYEKAIMEQLRKGLIK